MLRLFECPQDALAATYEGLSRLLGQCRLDIVRARERLSVGNQGCGEKSSTAEFTCVLEAGAIVRRRRLGGQHQRGDQEPSELLCRHAQPSRCGDTLRCNPAPRHDQLRNQASRTTSRENLSERRKPIEREACKTLPREQRPRSGRRTLVPAKPGGGDSGESVLNGWAIHRIQLFEQRPHDFDEGLHFLDGQVGRDPSFEH